MTILIADDEPALRRILEWNFAKAGFRVVTAEDGTTALERVRAELPDAVLLDAMMPGATGPDVCKAIRADPSLAGLTVGILSAKGREEAKDLAEECGADFFETKPFSPAALVERIRTLLGGAGSEGR